MLGMFICLFGITFKTAELISTKPSVVIQIIPRKIIGLKVKVPAKKKQKQTKVNFWSDPAFDQPHQELRHN